jgi:hypothetical protein
MQIWTAEFSAVVISLRLYSTNILDTAENSAVFILELRGDIQTLGLGQPIARAEFTFLVLIFNQPKFRPVYFFPCRLHITDSLHYVIVGLSLFVILTKSDGVRFLTSVIADKRSSVGHDCYHPLLLSPNQPKCFFSLWTKPTCKLNSNIFMHPSCTIVAICNLH